MSKPPIKGRVTRQDVAARAGTSPAVVSYVLNNGPRPVSATTRERVLRAVQELGYRPNSIARAMRTQKTMTIGLIVPDTSNPFFGEASRAIEEAAFARGYMVVIGNAVENAARQISYIRAFIDQQVDGLIILPQYGTTDWVPEVLASAIRCVVLDRPHVQADFPTIGVQNKLGAVAAVSHLIGTHGHTRIACLAGPSDNGPMDERVAGWEEAFFQHGLEVPQDLLIRGGFHREDGIAMARQLAASNPRTAPAPGFDAIFAASDEHAFGVLRGLHEYGLAVPEHTSLVGFDGVAAGASLIPSLTSVRRPFRDLAELAVSKILQAEPAPPGITRLPVTLQVGESCGCSPTARSATDV